MSFSELSDSELMQKLRTVPVRAMDQILRRYGKQLERTIWGILSNKCNVDIVHDIYQETALRFFKCYSRFTPKEIGGKISSLLYAIALNYVRERWRANHGEKVLPNLSYLNTESSESSPSINEMINAANLAIQNLPEKLRVVMMANMNHMKADQIAKHYDIPIGTVYSRLHGARQLLKRDLNRFMNSDE